MVKIQKQEMSLELEPTDLIITKWVLFVLLKQSEIIKLHFKDFLRQDQ